MKKEKINIITGKIKTGKTTYVLKNILPLEHCCGILQPQSEKKRFFKDIISNESKQITREKEDENTFRIGDFIFDEKAFEWAREILKSIYNKKEANIIIDEFGPLEFNERGLEPEVSQIIRKTLKEEKFKLTIVVRKSLLEKFISRYNLEEGEYKIIEIRS